MNKYLIVPSNFDAGQLLREKPADNYKPKVKPLYLNYIVHSINHQIYKDSKRDNPRYEQGVAPLSTEILGRVMSKGYISALMYLVDCGVVECKRKGYYEGSCRLYTLS